MSRISFSANFTEPGLNILDNKSKSLSLSRSSLLESLLIVEAYESGYKPSTNELKIMTNGFLMNSTSSLTGNFREQFSRLSPEANFALIYFLCSLNLIPNISISSQKQTNIKKDGILVCYFAAGVIGRGQQVVFDFVHSLNGVSRFCLGPNNEQKNEYFFLSKKQQFIKTNIIYPYFNKLCQALGVPVGTDIIQVHFSQINSLVAAFKTL